MRFGVHVQLSCAPSQSPVERYRDTIDQALAAEDLGFDSIWPVEQHFEPAASILPAPMLLLASLAAQTTTLRLGTAVTLLPLAHPVRVAEEVAVLDLLSGGRVECGVGRGQDPAHFAGLGVATGESAARFTEGIDILRRALTEERFSYDGAFHRLVDVAVVPRPLQRPRPPVHLAANSAETFQLAGRLGLPIIVATHINPLPRLTGLLEMYRQARASAGHDDGPDDVTVLAPTYTGATDDDVRDDLTPAIAQVVRVASTRIDRGLSALPPGPDGDAARARLHEIRATFTSLDIDTMASAGAVFGTPDECIERVLTLRDVLGANRLICWFEPGGVIPHHRVLRSMAHFSELVRPVFEAPALAA